MKKTYNQPQTEIARFETETLLQGIVMSPGAGDGPGITGAPRRRGEIIP